jgi:hypothetical protein
VHPRKLERARWRAASSPTAWHCARPVVTSVSENPNTVSWPISPLGCLVYGLTFAHSTIWVGPCAGVFLPNFALPCGPNVALTYVVDGYLPWAGEAMVAVNALKNLVALGMKLWFCAMVNELGTAEDVRCCLWYFGSYFGVGCAHVSIWRGCKKDDCGMAIHQDRDYLYILGLTRCDLDYIVQCRRKKSEQCTLPFLRLQSVGSYFPY